MRAGCVLAPSGRSSSAAPAWTPFTYRRTQLPSYVTATWYQLPSTTVPAPEVGPIGSVVPQRWVAKPQSSLYWRSQPSGQDDFITTL